MKKLLLYLLLIITQYAAAQVAGCTDPMGSNYNPSATVNDGSCKYIAASIAPDASYPLSESVEETSGLTAWGEVLYTHNDNNDTNIYALNPATGNIVQTLAISGAANQDWEDIAQDDDYIYVGDFGNNVSGNRQNLRIVKVSKLSLSAGEAAVENISFTYSNQDDFSARPNNSTDFDCEAMVVSTDSIYLFTKQWNSKKTSVYRLPKTPGNHIAQLKQTFDVNGLITGAVYLENKRIVVLTGYSSLVQPFLYILYDFDGKNFFSANKRKIGLSGMAFHQVEGVATFNGLTYYVSNERLSRQPFVNVGPKLHSIDLSEILGSHFNDLTLRDKQNADISKKIVVYPNPAGDVLTIDNNTGLYDLNYTLYDTSGKRVLEGMLSKAKINITISQLTAGTYNMKIDKFESYKYTLVKQ